MCQAMMLVDFAVSLVDTFAPKTQVKHKSGKSTQSTFCSAKASLGLCSSRVHWSILKDPTMGLSNDVIITTDGNDANDPDNPSMGSDCLVKPDWIMGSVSYLHSRMNSLSLGTQNEQQRCVVSVEEFGVTTSHSQHSKGYCLSLQQKGSDNICTRMCCYRDNKMAVDHHTNVTGKLCAGNTIHPQDPDKVFQSICYISTCQARSCILLQQKGSDKFCTSLHDSRFCRNQERFSLPQY